jgi:hypothetical protein
MMRSRALLMASFAGLVLLATGGVARATIYNLHVGGMCSTNFNDGKGGTGIGNWANEEEINVYIDQRGSVSSAASSFKTSYLDVYCVGSNWCYIYNYSAGDVVLGYLFANYGNIWNIGYTVTSGGAGGGSNLAGDIAGTLTCSYANSLTESSARGLYNHSDTNSTTVYRLGGYKNLLESSAACAAGSALNFLTLGLVSTHCLSSGADKDGAVEYHSAAGYTNTNDYTDFWNQGTHWTGHASYFTPSTSYDEGDNLNHYELKRYGVCMDGGISGQSGWSACVAWADAQH